MKVLLTLLVALAVMGLASADVKTATQSNFDSLIGSSKVALVKFYAPWCGHCKKLAPEFEKAATQLKDKATLVDVDCTVESSLCSKYEVSGYPTLYYFRNGKVAEQYEGPRDAAGIVRHVQSSDGPAMKTATTAEELASYKEAGVTCVVVSSSAEGTLVKLMEPFAQRMRTKLTFVLVTDESIAAGDTMETVTVYRSADEKEKYSGELSEEGLKSFFNTALIPIFGEMTTTTYGLYAPHMKTIPFGWVFLKNDSDASLKTSLAEVAAKVRKQMLMFWINADVYEDVGRQMAVAKDASYPTMAITIDQVPYVHPPHAATKESIAEFVDKYLKGELKPSTVSDAAPEVDTTDGLTVLVGTTLPKYLAKEKDMMLFFYAPWCGHCKSLLPTYAELAKALKDTDVIIAQIDATTNSYDRKKFLVSGYPTLYFIPAGKEPMQYNGDRSLEKLKEFVMDHLTTSASSGSADADL